MKPSRRLTAETFTVSSPIFDIAGNQVDAREFDIQISYQNNIPIEIAFAGRGKIGQGIDLLFTDVGIWLSRLLQNRDPMTGEGLNHGDN